MNVRIDPTTHPAYRDHDPEDVVMLILDAGEEANRLAALTALVMRGAADPHCRPEHVQAGLQAIHDRLDALAELLETSIGGAARVLLGVVDGDRAGVQ